MGIINGYAINIVNGISNNISELPPSEAVIFGIASILLISAIFAFIARILRQPLIPAYVIAGLFAGPLFLGLITSKDIIHAFLEIGIVFLLFIAGLEISIKKIREANLKKILLIGVLQVIAIFLIIYFTRDWFNLSALESIYLGIMLAFSSTMVDIKLLADKGELVTLHGRLVLGILLLQDLVAIIAIALLTAGEFSLISILFMLSKLTLIILLAILLQQLVLERIFKFAAKSTELLFITSLGVLFLFIILSYISEISIAIGAFIAGISLANTPFKTELESRISPIKDFFAILFFVALGMQIMFAGLNEHLSLLIFLIIISLIIKPIILFILLRFGAYQTRTSFQTAITLGQLSEFSLIIGLLGLSTGALTNSLFSTIILATVVSMSLTPYFIHQKNILYQIFKKPAQLLNFLPEKITPEHDDKMNKTVLLIGAHRIGGAIIKELEKQKQKLIVIDHNPEIIKALTDKKITSIYGDVLSPEILNKVNIKKLKLVICTQPGYEENLIILKKIKKSNRRTKVIVTGQRISETLELYEKGADYVITPKIIAGQELSRMIRNRSKISLTAAKNKHLQYLREIHNVLY